MRSRPFVQQPAITATALALLLGGAGTGIAGGPPPGGAAAGGGIGLPENSAQPQIPSQPDIAAQPQLPLQPASSPDKNPTPRAALEARGVRLGFTYFGEVLGNPSGGFKQGASGQGLLSLRANVDLGRLAGLNGVRLRAEGFAIHGRSLSGNNTLDLFTTSSIQALPTLRLYEAWIEQASADGKLFVRLGQQGADSEFFISRTASLFIDSTFGAPAILANDLPSGGPVYPLAAPAVLVGAKPTSALGLVAALFDGDPAGPYRPGSNSILPELRNPSGTSFRLRDRPLLFAEARYGYSLGARSDASLDAGAGAGDAGAGEVENAGLPGTIKLGLVRLFGRDTAASSAASAAFANTSIAATQTMGVPAGGNGFGYGVIDQAIYRAPGSAGGGVSAFLRVAGAPSDRNLIDLYVDAGLSFKGLVPGRPDDTFGVAGAYARVSPPLAALDAAAGLAPLVRDENGVVEATYQYAVSPGFTLQPDAQYLFHPGGHAVAIPGTNVPLHDAAVFGLRATIRY